MSKSILLVQRKPVDIVKELIDVKEKRKQKKIIKDAWNSDNENFFEGIYLSIDPSLDFKLKKVPEIQDDDDGDPGTLTFEEFYAIAMKLDMETLDEKESRALVNDAAMRANVTEWNLWYRRILLKTLGEHLPMDLIKSVLSELTNHPGMLDSE